MKVFFDTEFTGLHQHTTLISIGMVSEKGHEFYAEFSDYNFHQIDDFILKKVLKKLLFHNVYDHNTGNKCYIESSPETFGCTLTYAYGNTEFVSRKILYWLTNISNKESSIEMWSDCLSYDWVLFNQLWGHALSLPKNIYYIPFDICTFFKLKGIDPDISREAFAGINDTSEKHNALFDARVIKACYEKLLLGERPKQEFHNDRIPMPQFKQERREVTHGSRTNISDNRQDAAVSVAGYHQRTDAISD